MLIQQKYLESKDKNFLNELWQEVFKASVSATAAELKKRGVIKQADVIESMAMEATTVIMNRFHRKPDYSIKKSWNGCIHYAVRNAINTDGFSRTAQNEWEALIPCYNDNLEDIEEKEGTIYLYV